MTNKETNAEASAEELQRELSQHYGIVAARFCGLPEQVVRDAEQFLPQIEVSTIRCNGRAAFCFDSHRS